jgi:hypothetical protein
VRDDECLLERVLGRVNINAVSQQRGAYPFLMSAKTMGFGFSFGASTGGAFGAAASTALLLKQPPMVENR